MRDIKQNDMSRPAPSNKKAAAIDAMSELKPHLPQDLIGGSLPHIPGTEDEAVWNAASQACGTEKIHYCYAMEDDRIWYLACPSASLASNPDSWCPLAAALPGNSEYWDRETVYLYEQEGIASALRWDPESGRMQVFLGASRTILPRVQSMDANFASINADAADVVPWRNRTLMTEKLSRQTAKMLVVIGVLVTLVASALLAFNWMSLNLMQMELDSVKKETEEASLELIQEASSAMKSDTTKHMVRVQELLDSLSKLDGTLVRYEVEKGKVEWEALVPPAFALEAGQKLSAKPVSDERAKDGRIRIIGKR